MFSSPKIYVIVIGRNEATRLKACINSVVGLVDSIVYVDSASSDASVEIAHGLGSHITGFKYIRDRLPPPEYIQFIDGGSSSSAGDSEK